MSFPVPLLHCSEPAQDCVPEEEVCSVDSKVPCEPDGIRSPVPSPPPNKEDCTRSGSTRSLADVLDALM